MNLEAAQAAKIGHEKCCRTWKMETAKMSKIAGRTAQISVFRAGMVIRFDAPTVNIIHGERMMPKTPRKDKR